MKKSLIKHVEEKSPLPYPSLAARTNLVVFIPLAFKKVPKMLYLAVAETETMCEGLFGEVVCWRSRAADFDCVSESDSRALVSPILRCCVVGRQELNTLDLTLIDEKGSGEEKGGNL
jgi:hypothetical protein